MATTYGNNAQLAMKARTIQDPQEQMLFAQVDSMLVYTALMQNEHLDDEVRAYLLAKREDFRERALEASTPSEE